MRPAFYLKNGELSRYALACGYVELFESARAGIRLWFENGCFHVHAMSYENHKRIFWHSVRTIGEARAIFRAAKLEFKK